VRNLVESVDTKSLCCYLCI